MPAIKPADLVDAIVDAIQQSGHSVILLDRTRQHPRRFAISSGDGTTAELWVYAWTLTFGGRTSLPDEYRIQMTTVRSPLPLNPSGPTVLIGYEPNLKLFAGFDISRHQRFTSGSPSVQIDIRKVRDALQDGLTFDRKDNGELAIGIRPDQFVNYAMNAEHLHRQGTQPATTRLLTRAAQLQPITQADLSALTTQRQRIVQTVARLSRLANFRRVVLSAYECRCCVTRIQLRLVDAAHLVPVGATQSSDHVTNGVALSATYHRAFDRGLIYLSDTYEMRTNPARESELRTLNLDGGLVDFKSPLGRILLPQDRRQWPRVEFIRRARALRSVHA